MRFLILASLVLHSSLTLASPDKPGPPKSCPRQMAEWAMARWKWLAGGAVVVAATGYGIYEAVRTPDLTQLVTPDQSPKIQPHSLEAWQEKHAAASPALAFNRKTEWKLERGLVEAVDSGRPTEISFEAPLWHNGKLLREVELNDALDFTGVERAPARVYSEADRLKVEAITDTIKQAKPNELIVVHVQAKPALDYYLRYPGQAARYAAYPWNGSHQTASEAYSGYLRLTGAAEPASQVQNLGLTLYLEQLIRLADFKKGKPDFDLKAAFEEKAPKGNVLIISSFRGTRDTSVIEDLPSAESLRLAGYTSVTVLVDGLPVRPALYSADEVRDAVDFLKSLQRTAESRAFVARLKETEPVAYELLLSGKVQTQPEMIALTEKARAWHPSLAVQFRAVGP